MVAAIAAVLLVGLVPVAHRVEPPVTVGIVATVLWATLALESVRHAEHRREIRHAEHLRRSSD